MGTAATVTIELQGGIGPANAGSIQINDNIIELPTSNWIEQITAGWTSTGSTPETNGLILTATADSDGVNSNPVTTIDTTSTETTDGSVIAAWNGTATITFTQGTADATTLSTVLRSAMIQGPAHRRPGIVQ